MGICCHLLKSIALKNLGSNESIRYGKIIKWIRACQNIPDKEKVE